MTDIVELEKRVAALEDAAKTDVRDIRRLASGQQVVLSHAEATNRRVAVLELDVAGFRADVAREFAKVNERLDRVEVKVDAFIKGLPGMIAETMRDVLKETRDQG